jgi:hypothetical protein
MNDLVESNQHAVAQVGGSLDLRSLFSAALEAARDPDIDAGKMELLIRLATTQQDREAERRFRIAKQRALLEMPRIGKKGAILNKNGNVQSRYSRFEDMDAAVRPILAQHNLTISFNVGNQGQMITVQPILVYADGEVAFEERGGEMPVPGDTTGSKNATQGAGSAVSYGKRHAMKAMLNIIEAGEDDDGQQASSVALPPNKEALVDQARMVAKDGTASYAAFFAGLSTEDKGFLTYAVSASGETFHEQNKRAAALYD